jgi:hypothetical protein
MSTVSVLATNTTKQVKSFTVQATFKKGEKIMATASGAVNDLRPGEKRGITLLAEETVPKNYGTVRVDVDTMVEEADETEGSRAASKIKFGKPKISSNAGLMTVDVEVTNNDSKKHSMTVQATFLKRGQLLGIASGAVNDIRPKQTKTANLLAERPVRGYDQVLLAVETVVE